MNYKVGWAVYSKLISKDKKRITWHNLYFDNSLIKHLNCTAYRARNIAQQVLTKGARDLKLISMTHVLERKNRYLQFTSVLQT